MDVRGLSYIFAHIVMLFEMALAYPGRCMVVVLYYFKGERDESNV